MKKISFKKVSAQLGKTATRQVASLLIFAIALGAFFGYYDEVRALIGGGRSGGITGNSGHKKSQPVVANKNLVGHYDFEGNANDKAQVSANNLTDNNTVTQAAGRTPNAAQFTSSNTEYLSITDNAALSTGNIDFAVSVWVYLDTKTTTQSIVSRVNGNDSALREWRVLYNHSSDAFYFDVWTPSGLIVGVTDTAVTPVSTGTWYHVVAWHDAAADTISISVNNSTATSASTGGTGPSDTAAAFTIGAQATISGAEAAFNGRIDNVGFWKRTLTSNERSWLYNTGLGRGYSELSASYKTSLQAYWDLHEPSGSRADSYGSNTLTDNNTVTFAAGVNQTQAGLAYSSDGNQRYLTVADNTSFASGDVDVTYAGWVYLTSKASYRTMVAKGDGASASSTEYAIDYNPDVDRFRMYGCNGSSCVTTTANTLGSPTVNTWYFIVGWHDATGNTLNIQINNGTVDSTADTIGLHDTSQSLFIGKQGNTYMAGRLDNIGYWKRILSSVERASLYNSGLGVDYQNLSDNLKINLISWWNLDEPGGGTKYDNHRAALNHGTVSGASLTSGKYGQAYSFDGSNDYINVPDASSLDFTNAVTLSAWVKHSNSTSEFIISKRVSGGDDAYELATDSSGKPIFAIYISNTRYVATAASALATDTWAHVAGTFNGSTIKVYVNGVLAGSTSQAGSIDTTTDPLRIGWGYDDTFAWAGSIDDVRLYNAVLTESEIAKMQGASKPVECDQTCLGYWKLDEGSGSKNMVDSTKKNLTNMSDNNTVTQAAGAKIGNAAQFTAANSEYLSATDRAAISTGNVDFTIAAWVYLDSKTAPRTFAAKRVNTDQTTGEFSLIYDNSSDRFSFNILNGSTNQGVSDTTLGSPSTSTWYYVVGWVDTSGNTINIQTNNGTAVSATKTITPTDTAGELTIGGQTSPANYFMDGRIDEVGFWKRVLTSAERTSLYNSGSGKAFGSFSPTEKVGLIGYWPLDEASGTRYDVYGANAAVQGSATTGTEGVLGSGVKFDGSDDYILAPTSSSLNIGSSDFTLEAWVNGTAMANSDIIFGKSNGGGASTSYGFLYGVFDSLYPTLYFATSATAHTKIQAASNALSNGTWYHLVVVVDRDNSSNTKFYVNGAAVSTTVTNLATNTGDITNTVDLAIGAESDGGFYWDGKIDDVRMYNRVLPDYEIFEHYAAGRP